MPVCVRLQRRVAVAAGSQLPGRISGDGPRRAERSTSPPAGPARRHPRPDGAHQCPRKPGQSRPETVATDCLFVTGGRNNKRCLCVSHLGPRGSLSERPSQINKGIKPTGTSGSKA